jgi:hypothetical protein
MTHSVQSDSLKKLTANSGNLTATVKERDLHTASNNKYLKDEATEADIPRILLQGPGSIHWQKDAIRNPTILQEWRILRDRGMSVCSRELDSEDE